MIRLYIRRVLWSCLLIGIGLGPGGCPKPPPPPVVQPTPPPPPAPKGDLFRFSERAGAKTQGKVSIRIENEPLHAKPDRKGRVPGRLMRAYTLTEEHSVISVDSDGTQHITANLVDVEGKTDNPKEQREADALARALSEVKISFDRTARGDVIPAKLEVSDVNKPLDPNTARLVAGSIYGAGRGATFAEGHVEVGQTWPISADVSIPGGNIHWDITYTYQKKEGNVASVSFEGKSSGESQGTQITGDVKGEFRFDLEAGKLLELMVDSKTARDPGPASQIPGTVLRVHLEWEEARPAEQASAGGAQPTSPAPRQQ